MPDIPTDIAFWSNVLSDASGNFASNPLMTIQFDTNHSSVGLTLHFSESYPLGMVIKWYNSSNLQISEKTFVPNSLKYIRIKQRSTITEKSQLNLRKLTVPLCQNVLY